MAKHSIYQIKRENKELYSSAIFYGTSGTFTQAAAIQAFKEGKYTNVADVEAPNLAVAKSLVNNDRSSSLVLILGPLRNITTGDIIHNVETQQWFIVGPNSDDLIKIRVR